MWYSDVCNRGLWAGRPVWQGNPGSRLSFPYWVKKGGDKMGNILRHVGIRKDVTMEAIGWLFFGLGLIVQIPAVSTVSMAIARALPKALYGYFQPA